MEKYDVLIIGSGLGGLQCGYILAKNGYRVCVVEKNPIIGGCLQSFRRARQSFDTGFHYVGALSEGESLNRIFDYFGLLELPWKKLDEACFDEVIINGDSFSFANGYERFVETLSERFPHERENLKIYVSALKKVGDNIFDMFNPQHVSSVYESPLFTQTAYDFLNSTIHDPLLRQVLSGTSLKMELCSSSLPFYVFAQINDSFIRSAWRLKGGGQQIADSLRDSIVRMGGSVLTRSEVTELVEKDGKIECAIINDEDILKADYFISDAHPAHTLRLAKNSARIRKVYRDRILTLPNTYGMFTVNIKLKPNMLPYQNKNIYIYETDDLWKIANFDCERRPQCAMVSYAPPADGEFASNFDILTPMSWAEVKQWQNSLPQKRGSEYEEFKQKMSLACIELVERYIGKFSDSIDAYYSSTPLTYRDYTYTEMGSAYGIRKDSNRLMQTMITTRTPVPNLLLTGQNLNLHGILGVSITSFLTCAEILGRIDLDNLQN